jgi:hypothetical protein
VEPLRDLTFRPFFAAPRLGLPLENVVPRAASD